MTGLWRIFDFTLHNGVGPLAVGNDFKLAVESATGGDESINLNACQEYDFAEGISWARSLLLFSFCEYPKVFPRHAQAIAGIFWQDKQQEALMKRSRFTENQPISNLEAEVPAPLAGEDFANHAGY